MAPSKQRSVILAVGAAATVMVGAYSGANMKEDTKKKQIRQEFMAEPVDQKIARLEAQKTGWTRKRDELLKKIEQMDEKIAERDSSK